MRLVKSPKVFLANIAGENREILGFAEFSLEDSETHLTTRKMTFPIRKFSLNSDKQKFGFWLTSPIVPNQLLVVNRDFSGLYISSAQNPELIPFYCRDYYGPLIVASKRLYKNNFQRMKDSIVGMYSVKDFIITENSISYMLENSMRSTMIFSLWTMQLSKNAYIAFRTINKHNIEKIFLWDPASENLILCDIK